MRPLLPLAALALMMAPVLPAWADTPMAPGLCPLPALSPLQPGQQDQLELSSDSAELQEGGVSHLLGTVQAQYGNRNFAAPELFFDEANRLITVKQLSQYRDAQMAIAAESLRYNLNTDEGTFTNSRFTLIAAGGHGSAEQVDLTAKGHATLRHASYTSCAEGDDAWLLSAGQIALDQDEGLGVVHNATLRLSGVPVLYVPYLQFPIDNRRRSGLLFPFLGSSTRVGLDLRQPVYLNLAENYDAIVTPRLMSDRGFQLGVAGRYLFSRAQGRATVEGMARDEQTGQGRSRIELQHDQLLSSRLALTVNYSNVSDRRYFEDLGQRSDFASLTYLEQSARLTYHAPASYTLTALVADYQPLSSALPGTADPYRRLPEVRFDAVSRNAFNGVRVGGFAAVTNFSRRDSVHGLRETLNPFVVYSGNLGPLSTGARADWLYTGYQLQDTLPGQSQQPQRSTPIFSAEAALPFARLGSDNTQTLTPRLLYLYTPYRQQDSLPLFDTGQPDYDVPQLFARNRFTGGDRIADANQVTTAVTWRMLDNQLGIPRMSASLGQIYRFADSRVTLPGGSTPQAGSSEYLAEADMTLHPNLSASLRVNALPNEDRINNAAFAVNYSKGATKAAVAYRFRRQQLEQADLSFVTPIAQQWRIAGRWRESLSDSRLLDALLGVEYETCCYALRTSYRRYLINSKGDFNTGIFLQLELKGLTRFGTGFDEYLPGGSNRSQPMN